MTTENTFALVAVDYLGTLSGVQLSTDQRQAMLDTVVALPPSSTLQDFLNAVSADARRQELLAPVVDRLMSLPARYGRLFGDAATLKSVPNT